MKVQYALAALCALAVCTAAEARPRNDNSVSQVPERPGYVLIKESELLAMAAELKEAAQTIDALRGEVQRLLKENTELKGQLEELKKKSPVQ